MSRFKLAKMKVGETISSERFTEDSFITIQDQVSRFLNLGIPVSSPDFYDIDESKGQDDENIVPFSVYGADPVDTVRHGQLVESIAHSITNSATEADGTFSSSKSEVLTSDSLPQGSNPTSELSSEALKN